MMRRLINFSSAPVGVKWLCGLGHERIAPFAIGLALAMAVAAGPVHLKAQTEGAPTTAAGEKKVMACNPGPWGELEYHYTFLQAPDSLVDLINVPSWQTVWRFPELDKNAVVALIKGCQLRADIEAQLLNDCQWLENDDETRLFPTVKVVALLSTEERRKIYRELRRWRENPSHWAPVIIESGSVREWFADSGLSDQMIEAVEGLVYPLGSALAFSDVPMLIARSGADQDDRLIVKSMTRTRTLMLRLKVSPATDLETVRDYWSVGHTHTDALSLIDTISRSGEGESLDITHLLPPTPRKHIYSFPSVTMGMSGSFPDSLWTAANFFTFQPDDPALSAAKFMRKLEADYREVERPYRYGDILLLRRSDLRGAMQAGVYIADDIVYTRTGRQMSRPWLLKQLNVLQARFSGGNETAVEIKAWRKRNVPGS